MPNASTSEVGVERRRAQAILDESVACRGGDAERSRQLALDARVLARAHDLVDLEGAALYQLASIAHQHGRTEYALSLIHI